MAYPNIQQPSVPNADDKWTAAEHNGNLLLFFPVEVRRGIKTSNGDADAVRCARVVNLDTGRILHDPLIFGTALVPNIGGGAPDGVVLGRLGQGQGKNGNNPPWILLPHDEQDLRRAQDWLARDAQGQLQQPAGPPTPPAYGQGPTQGGWGQQPSAAAPAAPATGGWGAQSPQQSSWGAPAPAASSAPPAPQGQFDGQWGNAAPASGGWGSPAPAPAIDPGLVEALKQRGVDPAQLQNQAHAEQIAASMGLTKG